MRVRFILPIVALFNLIYLFWVVNFLVGALSYVFYVAEWGIFSLTLIFGYCHWERKHVRGYRHPPKGKVDVFVTHYNEPFEMIKKTLVAATKMEYKDKTVYLLDDANDPMLKKLAIKLGAKYLARGHNKDSKAGNMNHGLENSNSEFILVIDADHVASKNFIKDTLGHFQDDPKIAIVTTRQKFDVHDKDFQHENLFYEHIQTGKNMDNCAISCGNGVLYRRSAIEDIGGFQTWNIVEDLDSSYELHKKGYKSIYVNKAYTIGLAPHDLKTIYKQRGTWAVDSLRIFFWKNPLFAKGLKLSQKIHYFELTYSYIVGGLFIPILMVLPIISLLFNFPIISAGPEYLIVRAPGLIAIVAFYWLLNKGHKSNQYWAGLWPVFLKAIFLSLKKDKAKYEITAKIEENRPRVKLVLPQLLLVLLGMLALLVNILAYQNVELVYTNGLWIMLNLWWMHPIILHGLHFHHKHEQTLHSLS